MNHPYKALILDIKNVSHFKEFEKIKKEKKPTVYDQLRSQLCELIKNSNPEKQFSLEELMKASFEKTPKKDEFEYGLWVYYPWNNALVHLVEKEEFIFLRTIRNRYKITTEEDKELSTKKVGVIGLSVGQSVALTLSMERSYGELRIADFDTLELTNLNRIRTSLLNLSIPKTVAVAREIAEIDPFLKVTCFHEGIHDGNMDQFIGDGKDKLDVLIDECDSLDIKIKARLKAKEKKIPVLMDTSDRGMLDIERFDLESDRKILHGLLETHIEDFKKPIEKKDFFKLAMLILDENKLSENMKYSISQIGNTITNWPQLASSVIYGGGITAEVYRNIILRENVYSGRYYFDIEKTLTKNHRHLN